MLAAARAPRILLAEDDGEMREWLRHLLRPTASEVRAASSGWELLTLLAEDRPFDLVVSDVRMPGPNGLQVAAMARTAEFVTPFLIITAFPDQRLREAIAEMPSVELLPKPFEKEEFLIAAKRLVGGSLRARLARIPDGRIIPCRGCGGLHIALPATAEASFCPNCLERPSQLGAEYEGYEVLGGGD